MVLLASDDVGYYPTPVLLKALHADTRVVKFKYAHCDSTNSPKRWLETIKDDAHIRYNYFADTKFTCEFSMDQQEAMTIDFSKDRIQPFMFLRMPDGKWAAFPLGIFILSAPAVDANKATVERSVKGFDPSLILRQNKIEDRHTNLASETIYSLLLWWFRVNSINFDMAELPTSLVLGADRSWDAGTTHWQIVVDLLDKAGMAGLWFDQNGIAIVKHYQPPSDRSINVFYDTNELSVISEEAISELDLFDLPNKWILTVSQPDRAVMTATLTNNDPKDPTSTVSRGRTIVDFRTDNDSVSQDALNLKVRRIASEAAQNYEQFSFKTALMPLHWEATTVKIKHDPLSVDAVYNEVEWEMPLKAGSKMSHKARRSVMVGGLPVT